MSHMQSHRGRRQPPTVVHETSADLAATKIQASFRGYQVRKKHLHRTPAIGSKHTTGDQHDLCNRASTQEHIMNKPTMVTSRRAITAHLPLDADKAATRIQASFRGYMTRRISKGTAPTSERSMEVGRAPVQKLLEQNLTNDTHFTSKPATLPLRARNQNTGLSSPSEYMPPNDAAAKVPSETPETTVLNKAATVIQSNFRGYYTRRSLHSMEHASYHHCSPPTTRKSDHSDSNKENADQAATRIQAVYRGFIARKRLKRSHMPGPDSLAIGSSSSGRLSPSEAATRIQAAYRGFSTRQHYSVPKSPSQST